MPASVLVDAGFVVALLVERDTNHAWANLEAVNRPPPWHTCEAAICEIFYLLAASSQPIFVELLRRGAVIPSFRLTDSSEAVLTLLQKYADVPMSFADACLVRMTELLPEPILLTTDNDFRIYRRHSRRAIPLCTPVVTRVARAP